MAVIVIQMGHVPRVAGRTGTWREQELARAVGKKLRALLLQAGQQAHLMGADDRLPVSRGDVFVALHGDSGNASFAGRGQSTKRGASVGYPDENGKLLGRAWKDAHAAVGWPGGFLSDNNTVNMSQYYMWAATGRFKHRYLAEHATMTNSKDEAWIFGHLDEAAAAHVSAIKKVLRIGGGSSSGSQGAPATHTVRSGETLSSIGRKFGIDFRQLAKLNGINPPFTIFPGQVLKLRKPPASDGRKHVVKAGETLFGIAAKFGVDLGDLQRLNDIKDASKIFVGQVLRIP